MVRHDAARRRYGLDFLSIAGLVVLAFCLLFPPRAPASTGIAYLMTLKGRVGQHALHYVVNGLRQAENLNARIVILEIDTGGRVNSATFSIARAIVKSSVPVAGFVHPSGAQLGPAGIFILYACPVASMAPGTYLTDDKPRFQAGHGPHIGSLAPRQSVKVFHTLREMAIRYGRTVWWPGNVSRLDAVEALRMHIVDFLAISPRALLFGLNGRHLYSQRGWQTVQASGLSIKTDTASRGSGPMELISGPDIVYLLLVIGIFGIIFELSGPGLTFPGIIGTTALVIALFAMRKLQISYTGLGLLMFGIALMASDAYMGRFRLLGLSGIAVFTVGSLLLFELPGSRMMIGGLALILSSLFLWIIRHLFNLRRRGSVSGRESMIGATGIVVDDFSGSGYIRLNGELWRASSNQALCRGQRVRIVGIDHLILNVLPEEK